MTAMNRTGIQYRTLWQPRLILRDPDGAMVQERILPGAHSRAAPALVSRSCVRESVRRLVGCHCIAAPSLISFRRNILQQPPACLHPPAAAAAAARSSPLVVLTTDYNNTRRLVHTLGCRTRSPPLLPPLRVAMASERCCKSGDFFLFSACAGDGVQRVQTQECKHSERETPQHAGFIHPPFKCIGLQLNAS